MDHNNQPDTPHPLWTMPVAPSAAPPPVYTPPAGPPHHPPGIHHRRAAVIAAGISALVLIIILILRSTSTPSWSPAVQNNFMQSCTATSGGYAAICACVLQKLEGQYSEPQIAQIEAQLTSTGQEPPAFQQIAQSDIATCS